MYSQVGRCCCCIRKAVRIGAAISSDRPLPSISPSGAGPASYFLPTYLLLSVHTIQSTRPNLCRGHQVYTPREKFNNYCSFLFSLSSTFLPRDTNLTVPADIRTCHSSVVVWIIAGFPFSLIKNSSHNNAVYLIYV